MFFLIIIGYLHSSEGNNLTRQIHIIQLISFSIQDCVREGTFLFKERTMSVIRANAIYVDQSTPEDVLAIHYEPRSDFINLSKLNVLVLARKLEAEEGEESQRTLTLKGWIWENVVKVLEIIAQEMRMDIEIELTSDEDIRMRIVREECLMDMISGGTSVTSMLH